jgi:hypothetical protein
VHGLQVLCESVLTKGISAENACEILTLAANCNLIELKLTCLSFISSNYNEVRKSEAYKVLSADLLRDILAEIGPAVAMSQQLSSSTDASPVKVPGKALTSDGTINQKPVESSTSDVIQPQTSDFACNEAKSTSDEDGSLKKVSSAPALMGCPKPSSTPEESAPPKSPVQMNGPSGDMQREAVPGKQSPFRFFGRI